MHDGQCRFTLLFQPNLACFLHVQDAGGCRISEVRKMEARNKSSLWVLLGSTILAALAVSGCNTVEGVGRDVEAAGDAIEDTAEDARD